MVLTTSFDVNVCELSLTVWVVDDAWELSPPVWVVKDAWVLSPDVWVVEDACDCELSPIDWVVVDEGLKLEFLSIL